MIVKIIVQNYLNINVTEQPVEQINLWARLNNFN